jgi:hypothetical protein
MGRPSIKDSPAASYSPTLSRVQYHRRWSAKLPGSEWDRAFPLRYGRRNTLNLPVAHPVGGGCVVVLVQNRTVDASNVVR